MMKNHRLPNERKMNIYHPPAGAKAQTFNSGLKYSSKTEDMNGFEEGVEFLPTMNAKKVEKRPRRWVVVIAVISVCLLLSLLAGFLVWYFKYHEQKRYNGHLRLTGSQFIDAYENSRSSEFAALANNVKKMLTEIYDNNQDVGPFHKETTIAAFSEGSIIAYYWSEFSVPRYKAVAFDKAMANIQASIPAVPGKLRNQKLRIESLIAFPSDPDIVKSSRNSSCHYSLHAKEGTVTTFATPGFPNSLYASNARCLWVLRADAGSVISLTFTTFDVEPCHMGNDYVKVYDSLSPVDPHSLVKLCGSYEPSYNLTFVSSQNVLLVMLLTDAQGRYPGFKAEFFQMPKKKTCGGFLTGTSGNFSSPYHPGHYPADMDCAWNIQVPKESNVKVRFSEFFLLEPGVPIGLCTKDYVKINNQKYCGQRNDLVVSSQTNEISVFFHSDYSLVDSGFRAEFLSYDSNDPCPGRFTCPSGNCIDKSRLCDGWFDCTGGSDERNCSCTEKQFRCQNGWCKPKFWVCDGVDDCGDKSDELQCQCPDTHFKCSNSKCILALQKCDGKDDCGDGSDEGACGSAVVIPCQEYTYKCRNNLCVNKKNPECDGEKDCSDNSDEDNCNCGKRSYGRQQRIVGGKNSAVGEWPWQVSLHAKDEGHLCGASLISEKWLVSAAHCFREMNSVRYYDPKLWTAYMGLHDQRNRTNSLVQKRSIKTIIRHSYFNDYTFDYDIAVLELASPVTFTKQIQAICLPDTSHDFPAGKSIWVTGWGRTKEEGETGANVLQKAEIKVINQTMCNTLLPNQITSRMICVGILAGGVDACQGDSGGPLTSIEADSRMFLAGIVSFGEGCARRDKPGVYTRVSKLRAWIKQQTGV